MFKKVLIANRGEIAVRIARTARQMGVATVAVYSDADARAPHVRACDEAVHIGAAAAAESYLIGDRIIDAAKRSGAEAIHPGYGFLSENAAFADALHAAGITFIGPTAETIRAMGSKSAAKDLMAQAGVPVTPGYQGEDQSVQTFAMESDRIGYPVLLKATAGGGGKGMRIVARPEDLADALEAAQREAKSAFGDDRFLVEKYLPRARHLEVQVFGDGEGDVVHMYERDCSVQRRHQKIIEEAPAPKLPAEVRQNLLEAGVNAAKAVNYRGAGTVEFLYDGADQVYFMEMNTRLQVEHPVSEAITGLDFVEWQLRIAAGEGLPLSQPQITETGHAFEARLYAENPDQNFAPSIGDLTTLRLPSEISRVDSGVEEGQEISPFYDPMIAKIITHGGTRTEALGRLRAALAATRAAGVETNARFLFALANDDDFAAGDVSTKYIDEHETALFDRPQVDARVLSAAAVYARAQTLHEDLTDPWRGLRGFRMNAARQAVYWVTIDGAPAILRLKSQGDGFDASLEPDAGAAARREAGKDYVAQTPTAFHFSLHDASDGAFRLTVDGATVSAFAARHGASSTARIWIGAECWDVSFPDPLAASGGAQSAEGRLTAPMPGVITLLKSSVGDAISAGDPLIVMEAMKMEHTIKAPNDGVVKAFRFSPGDQVKEGDLLVEFEEAE